MKILVDKLLIGISAFLLIGLFLLPSSVEAQTLKQQLELNSNVLPGARDLVKTGVKLVEEQDKIEQGLDQIKKAIAIAPRYVKAHSEYIRLKSYWLDQETEVQDEYEALMKKDPNNPVYPLALALGQTYSLADARLKLLAKVADLAPDTIWGKYAKARANEQINPDASLAAYLDAIEKDSSENFFYIAAFPLLLKQKKFDEAAALLTKQKAQPELKTPALNNEWNLQVAKMGGTDEAKNQLGTELKKLVQNSDDVETLHAARNRFRVLKDEESVKVVEEKISHIDPAWYPQRGQVAFNIPLSGGMGRHFFAGRQNQAHEKLRLIGTDIDPVEQIAQAEQLLSPTLQPSLRTMIYQRIFGLAVKNKDTERAVKYGELLLKVDSEDTSTLTGLAKVYATAGQKKDSQKADAYSQKALDLTKEFRPLTEVPANIPPAMFKAMMSEDKQRNSYNEQRLGILNARAFVLSAMGNEKEAESALQESLKLKPTEEAYTLLAKVLRKLGRVVDADKAAAESESLWRKEVLAGFKSEPIKDFELTTVKGEKVKLSDLKGKLVMINFWATWCVPCVKEMPILAELYDKYKAQGLEILAVSGDSVEDKSKIAPFALKNKLNFPVMFGENVPSLYDVHSYPTTIFVDRQGNIKYRSSGLDGENAKRNIEFIIAQLMNTES